MINFPSEVIVIKQENSQQMRICMQESPQLTITKAKGQLGTFGKWHKPKQM
jgi:hypothetical protein